MVSVQIHSLSYFAADHFANIIVNALKRVGHTDSTGRTKYPVGHVNVLKGIHRVESLI